MESIYFEVEPSQVAIAAEGRETTKARSKTADMSSKFAKEFIVSLLGQPSAGSRDAIACLGIQISTVLFNQWCYGCNLGPSPSLDLSVPLQLYPTSQQFLGYFNGNSDAMAEDELNESGVQGKRSYNIRAIPDSHSGGKGETDVDF